MTSLLLPPHFYGKGPLILRRRSTEIEMPSLQGRLEGIFTLRALRRGRVVREHTFKNLITNQGMNRIGNSVTNAIWTDVHVGIGTTTPAFTDTALANFLVAFNTNRTSTGGIVGTGAAGTYAWRRFQWVSNIGVVVGNLTEIGISWSGLSSGGLFSRALILDGGGSPTTFPIAADEQLEVRYELRLYPPLSDNVVTATINGVSTDVTTRAALVTGGTAWRIPDFGAPGWFKYDSFTAGTCQLYTGAIGAVTAQPSGSLLGQANGGSNAAYTADTFYNDCTASWNISVGNGTIRSMLMPTPGASFQCEFNPTFVKANTQTLALTQRFSWARV